MYRELKNKETLWASLSIQNLKPPFLYSPPQKDLTLELNLPGNLQEAISDSQDIQPFLSYVWNFDDIVFELNIIWSDMVCTYKLFTGDRVWRIQTCEIVPFWCTSLIFNHANEQCFILPVLVRQSTHSITTYPLIFKSTINYQYIWIKMGGLCVTYKVELITRLDCD